MATFVFQINGVSKAIRPGWTITESANGGNRMECAIVLPSGTGRPALDDVVTFTENGTRIFGGLIDRLLESGLGDQSHTAAIEVGLSVADFNIYASRIRLTADIPAGNYKAFLTVVATALSAQGVTLAVGQVNGPAIPARSYVDASLLDVLNEGAALASASGSTSYVWEIGYSKILEGFAAGTRAAPYNITDGDGNCLGDIVVDEPRQADYANYITLNGGTGLREVTDAFTGNGVTTTFALNYTLAANRGYVTNGAANETLGPGGTWTYNATTNSITRSSAPANLNAISITYTGAFPKSVFADGGAPAANRVQKTYTAPDVFDVIVMQALADSYLARDMESPKTVRYAAAFSKTGLHPGQVQTIASTKRNLSGSHLLTDVQIQHRTAGYVQRSVTAVSTMRLPSTLRESFQQTFGRGGGSSAVSGTVSIVSAGGVGGTGTVGRVATWATASTLTDTVDVPFLSTANVFTNEQAISQTEPKLYLTQSGAGSNLKNWRFDVASGVLSIQTVNDAKSSIIATPLAIDRTTLLATFAGGVTVVGPTILSSTLAVTGVGTFSTHVLPALTDTSDLGRYDRLWNQAYISQLNAIVYALTTQTLFGGYSTIGKQAGSFAADVAAAATTINFGQTMTVGNFVLVRAHDTSGTIKAEYITVGSNVSGTTYNVTRDLAAANSPDPAWASGTPFLVLGASGDGRIDLLAFDGKPRIAFVTQGATYNAQNDRAVIGNLNGYFGYVTDIFGAVFGDPSNAWLKIDPTNGVRIGHNTTTKISLDASGAASFSAGAATIDSTGVTITPASTNVWDTNHAYRFTVPTGVLGLSGYDNGSQRGLHLDATWTGAGRVPQTLGIQLANGGGTAASSISITGTTGSGTTGANFSLQTDTVVIEGITSVAVNAPAINLNGRVVQSGNTVEAMDITGDSGAVNVNLLLNGVSGRRATLQAQTAGGNGGALYFFTKPDSGADVAQAGYFWHDRSLVIGAPTGGPKGAGTINAQAVYDDNVLLTDWVFDLHYTGRTDVPHAGRLYSLTETAKIAETERRLPWMPSPDDFEAQRHTGGMITRLLQGQEQQQLYIQELETRVSEQQTQIEALAARLGALEGR